MAIQNVEGNYLKILHTDCISIIHLQIWKNLEARLHPTEFDNVKEVQFECTNLLQYLGTVGNPDETVLNNVITKCYLALKQVGEFAGWEDC